ncbi:uncharacterized protein LOC112094146, partial [Morus notabilis]|uniref:uncharacterized protein LOC112094146 n=1 Tax=Morus notabilis TaxID=981085 RepID=UPI000CECEE96
MVVDFGPKELESLYLSVPGSSVGDEVNVAMCTGGKRRGVEVYGPMDRYVLRKNHSVHQGDSSVQERASSSGVQLGGSLGSEKNITRKNRGQQVLVDWVWNYFSNENTTKPGNRCVIVSEKAPLYFQHDGHSRTIVGIQIKYQRNGVQQHNLLILDPGH